MSTVGSTSVDGSRLTIVTDMTVTGGRVLTQLSPQLHTIDGVHFMQGLNYFADNICHLSKSMEFYNIQIIHIEYFTCCPCHVSIYLVLR